MMTASMNQENTVAVGSILLFQRIVPSYRVSVFHYLSRHLGIVICHSISSISGVSSAHSEMNADSEILPGRFLFNKRILFSQRVGSVLKRYRPRCVICEYSLGNLTFWKLWLLRPVFDFKLVLWSHGIQNQAMVKYSRDKHARLTDYMLRSCDAAILYSRQRRDRLVERNPTVSDKCFVANNTLDTQALIRLSNTLSSKRQGDVRSAIGVHTRFNMVYIGRLLSDKRIDLIVESWKILRSHYNVGLLVIGDGPDMELICDYSASDGVYALGAIHDTNKSAPYLYCSDIMIMPGYVGLSIVHGFAFGLPMITCRSTENGPFHSPEIEYLKDGYNGFFCDSTPESIAACIERLILDPELLARMKENALETVRTEANVERMIDGFRQAIDYVTRDDKR
ncbi:MAG TPA: glycosyltransferase family 4 protein [Bacteroidota bacterium]|nr:glycosyltransferase family 4 protein [Bacteroidota bacterium]